MQEATTDATPKLELAPDGMQAHLVVKPGEDYSEHTPDSIIELLEQAEIAVTEDVAALVAAFCEQAASKSLPDGAFLITEGKKPEPPVDATLTVSGELTEDAETPSESDDGQQIDYHAQCHLATVIADSLVGIIEPSRPGVDGIDVLGKPVPVLNKPHEITLGEGVRLGDDGKEVYATIDGLIRVKRNQVGVVDVVEIRGDVDHATGSLDVTNDVAIRGSIRELFTVKTTKSIDVGKTIESADVTSGGDISVRGGIIGKGKGKIHSDGEVICKFCDASYIRAAGNIIITKEAMNTDLRTESQLIMPGGALITGTAYARGGAQIKEIGSEAEVRTVLTIGVDPVILTKAARLAAQAERKRAGADKVRETVGPLIANLKRLTPAQRERTTELIFRADSIQGEADEMLTRKDKMIAEASWHEEPALVLTGILHPGVKLQFEDMEFTAREVIHGPVKIYKQRGGEGKATALICANQLTGSNRELLCQKFVTEIPDEDEEQAHPNDGDGKHQENAKSS